MAAGAVGAAGRALLRAVPDRLEAAKVQDRGVLRRDGQVVNFGRFLLFLFIIYLLCRVYTAHLKVVVTVVVGFARTE